MCCAWSATIAPKAKSCSTGLRRFSSSSMDRVLTFAAKTARRCSEMHVPDAKRMHDFMIAASALQHGLALVNRTVSDFAGIHVKLIKPWGVEA